QLATEATAIMASQPAEEVAFAEPAVAPELPPVAETRVTSAEVEPSRPAGDFQAAFATVTSVSETVAQVAQDAVRFVQQPVVQACTARAEAAPAPVRAVRPDAAPARAVAAAKADGTHLVQLGSFGSRDSAERAWGIYAKRYPELAGHQMVISEAVVR